MAESRSVASVGHETGTKSMEKDVALPTEVQPGSVAYEYSAADARKLVRKIDWRIMPYLWGYAVLSAVDVSDTSIKFVLPLTHHIGNRPRK
jgi:hypothetical protein